MTAALRLAVRVAEVTEVTPSIKRFCLEAVDGGPLPSFAGGAHILVEMQDGETLRRNAYSLMSPPAQTSRYSISVRRDPDGRGGSCYMHDHIEAGTELFISHPVNLFPIERRARKHLFVAGGIGITPFVAMAEQLFEEGWAFELHYATRSRDHAAYAVDLVTRYGDRVKLYHSELGERLPLETLLADQPLGTHLYVCGPTRMTSAAIGMAQELGWPEQAIHLERFVAPAIGAPFEVRLARSNLSVQVGSHQSMLEAIEAAGVDAPSLCRGGACGQCETQILEFEGTLIHADHFLTEAEKASGTCIMPCVSRFEGRSLVLDL